MGFLEDLWNGLTGQNGKAVRTQSFQNKPKGQAIKTPKSNKRDTAWEPMPLRKTQAKNPRKRDTDYKPIPLGQARPRTVQPNIRQAMRNDDPTPGVMPAPMQRAPEPEPMFDPMDDLLGGLQDFVPPQQDNSQFEAHKAEIMAQLDEMLGGQLAGLQGARNQIQGNFNTSDKNLEGMHRAFQNDISTSGKAAFADIGNDLTGSLANSRDQSVGALQALEAGNRNEMTAMLKNLGIQEAAPGLKSDVYDEASANIIGRTATDLTSANQQTANNQSFNQGLATTTGMQGMQRRAALAQQMQALMGDVAEKETDVRSAHLSARAKAEADLMGMQQESGAAAQEAAWEQYKWEQDRLDDRLGQLSDQNFQREQWDYDADMQRESMAAKAAMQQEEPVEISGFAGFTQDLANNYGPQVAQQVTTALSEVYNSPAFRQEPGGVKRDPTSVAVSQLVNKYGIPTSVALHAVTNYNQLGRTSKFTAQ